MSAKRLPAEFETKPMRWREFECPSSGASWPPPAVPSPDGEWIISSDSSLADKSEAAGVTPEEVANLRRQISSLEQQLSATLARLEPERQAATERGRAEAQNDASVQWAHAYENLTRALHDVIGAKARYRRDVEDDAVRLALAISRKILNREIAADPEALAGLVYVALGRINQRELYRIRVHPDDAARIKEHLARAGCPERVEIVPENGLDRGALVLETERGELDASVQVQLNEIDRGLTDILRHHR